MDMSNATAAGPSRGLFDVLFGSAPKDEPGDGQEFGPLMDIIKALNKGKEELSQESRTDKGTIAGLGSGESPVKMGSVDAMAAELAQGKLEVENQDRQLRERMAALYGIGMVSALANPATAKVTPGEQPEITAALPKLDAKDVNRALKEKSLPGLTEGEQKLLDAVNAKLETTNAEQSAAVVLSKLGKNVESQKPAPANEKGPESVLSKELVAKGIDPRELKSGEAQAAPEKIVTTDTYLKMHEAFGKAESKNGVNAKSKLSVGDDAQAPVSPTQQNILQNAVAEAKGKSQDMLGNAHGQNLEKLDGGKGAKAGDAGSQAFAEMMQSLKGEGSTETKNVFLTGKPEQMRPTLLNEVQQSVNFQAVKGGGEMRLVVHPPELGEVHLKVGTKEGKVEVSVTAENKQVADMIRGGSRELEASLQDKNLTLAKFEVSVTDSSYVASSDTKSNLSDQFMQQNQNSFAQNMARDDGSSAQRDSRNQRHEGSFGAMMNEPAKASVIKMQQAVSAQSRHSAGRLDVVA
jgi:flagellar hook-length control protein FliK